MAKILGIDIGYDTLKLALVSGRQVKKTAIASMPRRLMRDGRLVSPEAMGELLAQTMKKNGIRCSKAAIVFSDEAVIIRSVTLPLMTEDQLALNLPYEFRDYITGELKDYVFDYGMLTDAVTAAKKTSGKPAGKKKEKKQEKAGPNTQEAVEMQPQRETAKPGKAAAGPSGGAVMELLAVAAPASLLEETRLMLRKAGLKLTRAAPDICAFTGLIHSMDPAKRPESGEYCFLDLGSKSIRMHIFKGDRYEVSRVLDSGLSTVEEAIADAYHVDEHLAHTYMISNYDDCQSREVCMDAFNGIAVELMQTLSFYRFRNPESSLSDIWLCGGGAYAAPLAEAAGRWLEGMKIHSAEELLPGGRLTGDSSVLVQAIGITQE